MSYIELSKEVLSMGKTIESLLNNQNKEKE